MGLHLQCEKLNMPIMLTWVRAERGKEQRESKATEAAPGSGSRESYIMDTVSDATRDQAGQWKYRK